MKDNFVVHLKYNHSLECSEDDKVMDKTKISKLKTPLEAILGTATDHVKQVFAGATAGATSALISSPLDVVKTKLQHQSVPTGTLGKYRGTVGTIKTIISEEGLRGLYKGLGPSMLGLLPNWAIYFSVYNYSKPFYTNRFHCSADNPFVHLSSAVTAGAAAAAITNPLWVVKSRMMLLQSIVIATVFHALKSIYKYEHFAGLYKGFIPTLLGLTHVAVQFPLYEQCKIYLTNKENGKITKSRILLATASSKLIASLITYPHEVIRTRLQNQSHKPFKYTGVLQAVYLIKHEEGIRAFYKGLGTNLLRTVPTACMTLITYETIVVWIRNW